jgi:ATP-binding cassette subfamily B protein
LPSSVEEEAHQQSGAAPVVAPPLHGPGPDEPGAHANPLEVGFGWVKSLWAGLLPFLRPHRATFAIIGLLMCVELGLQMGQRKALSYLIDEAILKSQFGLLVLILSALFVAALIAGAAALAHEYMHSRLCARIPGEVRTRLFEHIQLFPLQRLRVSTHGDLITRITSDAGSVEPALWSAGYIASAICGIVFSFAILIWTEWRLTLIGVALLPLALIGPRILSPRAARESYTAKTNTGELATHLQENLANQIILRVFGLGRVARERFGERNERIIAAARRYNVYSYFSHRVPYIVIELLELLMLGLGGWFVLRGDLTPGNLVAFYLLFSGLCQYTWNLTATVPSLIGASAGMRRIHEVLGRQVPDPRTTRGDRFSGLGEGLRFEDVSFRYDGERNQFERVSLDVRKGEVVAFVGASGSGKSTALQLLLGLQTPASGRIVIGGVDLQQLSLGDYWSHVSAVFQDSLLFNTSIAENIRAGKLDATPDEIARAARAADIEDWVRTLPTGYGTIVSGDTCSGGQRQRIAIARALVREPELLVLDEPTSALDAATGAAVMQTLRNIAKGRTVVLVTHQLRDAADASRIVVFEEGRAVESGTHLELLGRGGSYARLWARQRDLPGD